MSLRGAPSFCFTKTKQQGDVAVLRLPRPDGLAMTEKNDMKKNFKINELNVEESPLFWPAVLKGDTLFVLNETLVPQKIQYEKVKNVKDAVKVIREMKTRAFGQFLVVLSTFLVELKLNQSLAPQALVKHLEKVADALNNSRPTFPFAEVTSIVTYWAGQALKEKKPVKEYVEKNISGYLMGIRMKRLGRVKEIAGILEDGDSVLTHCNVSGELAMASALCKKHGKKVSFFATETRPYLQGAKLTVWELRMSGASVTLIADNAVASVMDAGFVNKVIVGSDRNCANGDFANKIGTYQIAVLAKEFGIPFYVLTQPSTKVKKGSDMPIEVRDAKELLEYEGKKWILEKVDGFYPGFDVVPHKLVTRAIPLMVS